MFILGGGIVLVHLALALAALAGSVAIAIFAFRYTERWIAREPAFRPIPQQPVAYDRQARPVYETPPRPIHDDGPACMGPSCDRQAIRKSPDGPWVWCDRCAGPGDVPLSQPGDGDSIRPAPRASNDAAAPEAEHAPWWERRRVDQR